MLAVQRGDPGHIRQRNRRRIVLLDPFPGQGQAFEQLYPGRLPGYLETAGRLAGQISLTDQFLQNGPDNAVGLQRRKRGTAISQTRQPLQPFAQKPLLGVPAFQAGQCFRRLMDKLCMKKEKEGLCTRLGGGTW